MKYMLFIWLLLTGCTNHQQRIKVDLYLTENPSVKVGDVWFKDTGKGLLIEVKLEGLPQGEHGFYVYEYPDCSSVENVNGKIDFALSVGGYFDSDKIGKHLDPKGSSYLGNLPYLSVDENGKVRRSFYLKNINAQSFKNRSLIIHMGGDNYKDTPLFLGAGGKRIACGVVK